MLVHELQCSNIHSQRASFEYESVAQLVRALH